MKNILINILGIILLFNCSISQSQYLIGMSERGGDYGAGTIYKAYLDGSNMELMHSFYQIEGWNPMGKLLHADNGKIYGTAKTVFYEYDISTDTYKRLKRFLPPDAFYFGKEILQATNGLLYVVAESLREESGYGSIFQFNIETGIFKRVADFNVENGFNPTGGLIQYNDSILMGMAKYGGDYTNGTIYDFNINSNTITKRFDFNSLNGMYPRGKLLYINDSSLYGLTPEGGADDGGTMFRFNPINNTLDLLFSFYEETGSAPLGELIQASNGNLYGLTSWGSYNYSGTLFEYDLSNEQYRTVAEMYYNANAFPNASLVEASNGKLYGTAMGFFGWGGIFQYDFDSDTLTNVFLFDWDFGRYAGSTLIEIGNGLLYGTAYQGGDYDIGNLFQFNINTNEIENMFVFGESPTGFKPKGGLLKANNEKYYGTTEYGGEFEDGTLFEFNPETNELTLLANFNRNIGIMPDMSLIQASDNKLYGTTSYGGEYGDGTIFSYDIELDSILVEYSLHEDSSASWGSTGLVEDFHGYLYASSTFGGPSLNGTFYRFDPVNKELDVLVDLHENDELIRFGGPFAENSFGYLYGLSSWGGDFDLGVVIQFNPYLENFEQIIHFDGLNTGSKPWGSLMMANNDKMYGTTRSGGYYDKGTFFETVPELLHIEKKADFDGDYYGYDSRGRLMQATNDKLYGTTRYGGEYGFGTLFSYDIESNNLEKLYDLKWETGYYPTEYLIEIEAEIDDNVTDKERDLSDLKLMPNPSSNFVVLKSNEKIEGVVLRDTFGKKLMVLASGECNGNIDISHLQEGIYFITAYNKNAQKTFKFIKN